VRGGKGLERDAPFFLALYAFVLASLAVYRVRTLPLVASISPDLASGEGLGSYLAVAASSDALAAALSLVALASLWIGSAALGRVLGRALAWLSAFAVAAYSFLLAAAADFMRVYQTAFSKSFVGGEHFTGIESMLVSAAAEFSRSSRLVAAATVALLAASSVLTLRARATSFSFAAFRAARPVTIAAAAALAILVATGAARSRSAGEAEAIDVVRSKAVELGANPVCSLVFGPRRETFMPASLPEAGRASYDTDSLEAPGVERPVPKVEKGRRNVILYFFESTSWSYYGLELDGRPVMPAMRDLARNGLILRNHYSNYPLSANTLYSALSSRYSMYGKAMIFHEYYDVDVRTLPEVLRDEGYSTCFIHTGDLLYASRDKFLADRDIDALLLYEDLVKDERYRKNVGWGADERSMIDPAIEWIKSRDGPYLLMMAPVNPHHPYAIPEGFERIADPAEEGIGESERTWRNYLNSLHYADAALGLLVEALERDGLMENTVLVVVTDHGEAFYQHRGNYNHPLYVYEENVHVPALFYSKELFPESVEFDSVTRHVDIMPSILDLIGVKDSGRRDGQSIFSRSREKMAVFHTSWTDELMGVRDGRWKYIERMKDSREELYDLEADPRERINVAADFPAIAERYRGVADEMVAYMIDQYRDIARKPATSAVAPR